MQERSYTGGIMGALRDYVKQDAPEAKIPQRTPVLFRLVTASGRVCFAGWNAMDALAAEAGITSPQMIIHLSRYGRIKVAQESGGVATTKWWREVRRKAKRDDVLLKAMGADTRFEP